MRRGIFVSLLTIISFTGVGQVDLGGLLGSMISDPEYQLLDEQIRYMDNENFNLPWLRGVEARIRTKELDRTIEDYRFRIEFLNPFERAANKSFNQSFQKNLEIKKKVTLSDALFLRYSLLLRHFEYWSNLNRSKEDLELLNDLKELAQLESSQKDLLDLSLKITKRELEIEKLSDVLLRIEREISALYSFNGELGWGEFEMITPDQMILVLSESGGDEVPSLLKMASDLELDQKEYKLDKANSRRAIGYIQSEYDWTRGTLMQEKIGIQIGFSIPIVNPDRPKLQYSQLDLIEKEKEYGLLILEHESRLDQLQQEFRSKHERLGMIHSKLTEQSNLDASGISDLDLLLQLQEFKSELNAMEWDLRIDLLKTYIDILRMQGRFNEVEKVNFISAGLDAYQ